MHTKSSLSLVAAAMLAMTGPALATPSNEASAAFVQKAARGGLAEVELSKLAATRSSSEDVKRFATKMVEAHTENNAKLATIAKAEGLNVPSSLDAEHAALKSKLFTLNGAEFDRQYGDAMRADHTAMLKLLDDNAETLGDPRLKAFISDTRPVVAEHLEMAKNLSGG